MEKLSFAVDGPGKPLVPNLVSALHAAVSSRRGLQSPNPLHIRDCLFVGRSKDNPTKTVDIIGISLYDAGYNMERIHFANFGSDASAFLARASLYGRTGNRIREASFENVSRKIIWKPSGEQFTSLGQVVYDLDGTLTGTDDSAMVTELPIMRDSSCARLPNSDYGYLCPRSYARIFSRDGLFGGLTGYDSLFTLYRSDGVTFESSTKWLNLQVMVNTDYVYRLTSSQNRPIRLGTIIRMQFAKPGDFVKMRFDGCEGRSLLRTEWSKMTSAAQVWASSGPSYYIKA